MPDPGRNRILIWMCVLIAVNQLGFGSIVPVIALTPLAMKGDEERIRAAGCDGYIAKPMNYKDFLAKVALQLEA